MVHVAQPPIARVTYQKVAVPFSVGLHKAQDASFSGKFHYHYLYYHINLSCLFFFLSLLGIPKRMAMVEMFPGYPFYTSHSYYLTPFNPLHYIVYTFVICASCYIHEHFFVNPPLPCYLRVQNGVSSCYISVSEPNV